MNQRNCVQEKKPVIQQEQMQAYIGVEECGPWCYQTTGRNNKPVKKLQRAFT